MPMKDPPTAWPSPLEGYSHNGQVEDYYVREKLRIRAVGASPDCLQMADK